MAPSTSVVTAEHGHAGFLTQVLWACKPQWYKPLVTTPCDCDQSYDVHPPGYHSLECSIWGATFAVNLMGVAGNRLRQRGPDGMRLGHILLMASSVHAVCADPASIVDQRDGFEVMFPPCESGALPAPTSLTS